MLHDTTHAYRNVILNSPRYLLWGLIYYHAAVDLQIVACDAFHGVLVTGSYCESDDEDDGDDDISKLSDEPAFAFSRGTAVPPATKNVTGRVTGVLRPDGGSPVKWVVDGRWSDHRVKFKQGGLPLMPDCGMGYIPMCVSVHFRRFVLSDRAL